jgi:hypothetical protein
VRLGLVDHAICEEVDRRLVTMEQQIAELKKNPLSGLTERDISKIKKIEPTPDPEA